MEITSGLSHNQKKKIFEVCSLIRLTELEISKKYIENKMRCPVHLSVGQEGVSAVLSSLLKKKESKVKKINGLLYNRMRQRGPRWCCYRTAHKDRSHG